MDGFMEALQAAQASQDAYVAALPMWVQYWMMWLTLVLGLGALVFSFVRAEARWLLLATMIVSLVFDAKDVVEYLMGV
ncbi:MAG: hypothetical protein H5U13_07900 [Parvibaculum sp.]|nr:hypothetical protein [Parvibaculum sp.]